MESLSFILHESFWLPPGTHWGDYEGVPGYPKSSDILLYGGAVAFIFSLVRHLLVRYVYSAIGRRFLPEYSIPLRYPAENEQLNRFYLEETRNPHPQEVTSLADDVNEEPGFVREWFHIRRQVDKQVTVRENALSKFNESCVSVTHHLGLFIWTLWAVWGADYLSDVSLSWVDWPQVMPFHTQVVYLVHFGVYFHFLLAHFFQTVRKDFWVMFVHHIATSCLLGFSYICGFWRIGILVSLVHDVSDIFIQIAKLAKYLNYSFMCDIFFVLFAISFFLSRLVVFPFVLIRSTIYDVGAMASPSQQVFVVWLVTLFVLHVYWMSLIVKVVLQLISTGNVEKDIRSDSEFHGSLSN